MPRTELRFRQIHLDFHTSQHIAGVGSEFDAEEFAAVLAKARVDSVTCFARCHHGYVYYDTKAFPQRRHPHLTRNLLAEQIEACHKRDIRVPIYITVEWDHFTADEHPEWLVVSETGAIRGTPPYEAGFYRQLCLNSPYVDWLKSFVQEVLTTLPTDGFFFDIVGAQDCSCPRCRGAMRKAGLEPSDACARGRFGLGVVDGFKRDMTAFVRRFNRDCTIFYNAGHVGPHHRAAAGAYTHFELESLPSGGWGYLHFPAAVRYARTMGLDCLGMTGKFHTSWGDFHSFKNRPALEFECFNMLAMGAKCSIGDQLHPNGKICRVTYDLIGSVYAQVEKKEPFCRGARALADVAVFTPEEQGGPAGRLPASIRGATAMLAELAVQFDIIDSGDDLGRYKVLILPDEYAVSAELAGRIEQCLTVGGAVIATYQSGLNLAGDAFATKALGVTLKGPAPYSPDFIVPGEKVARDLPRAEHVMYLRGMEVAAAPASEVLAWVNVPYFNRTYGHFCSHRHTPSSGKPGYPGIVRAGRAIYFAHPIFTQYEKNAPRWCKVLLRNALDMLLPEPLLRLDAPTTALATVNEQADKKRWVVHLLHYIPQRRGQEFDIIEDVIPIRDVQVSLRTDRPVAGVTCVPEGRALEFRTAAGRTAFLLSELRGHQMIEVSFA